MPVAKDRIRELAGKKVRIATRAFHHLVGRLEGARDGKLALCVGGREVLVDPDSVVTIEEAFPEESEFVK